LRDGDSVEMATNSPAATSRLLDLQQAARYLGVSPWTVRDLEASGVIPRVVIPLPNGRDLRKLLFDRADLDRLIESWKLQPLTRTTASRYPGAPVRAGQR
jgi:helix-turn-helix protein